SLTTRRAPSAAAASATARPMPRPAPVSAKTLSDRKYPSPGLSIRTPEWFHARDVAAVAADTLTFEVFPPEVADLCLPVHALHLVEMGMPQGQNRNLEELSTACGETGRCAFLPAATPEPFAGGTGAPVAPVAVLQGPPRPGGGDVGGGAAPTRPEHGPSAPPFRLRRSRPAPRRGTDAVSRPALAEELRHRGPRRPLAADR